MEKKEEVAVQYTVTIFHIHVFSFSGDDAQISDLPSFFSVSIFSCAHRPVHTFPSPPISAEKASLDGGGVALSGRISLSSSIFVRIAELPSPYPPRKRKMRQNHIDNILAFFFVKINIQDTKVCVESK